MPKPIPREWLDPVIRILRTNDGRLIGWTPQARTRWEADTFGAWTYEAHDAIRAALETIGVEGNETTSMSGQSATYEFFFHHQSRRMYGKIALRNDRLTILILSAHAAERSTLSP